MGERPLHLPDFETPPIAEVASSVHFTLPKPLRVYHYGLYREAIRKDFPEYEEHPPLQSHGDQGLQLFTTPPIPRCWFLDEKKNRLIQLQTDRFIHNWRKVTGQEDYPRYEFIRDEFLLRWDEFVEFLKGQGLEKPKIRLCELTYVNHIPKDSCWSEPSDIPGIFNFLDEDTAFGSLPSATDLVCRLRYDLPNSQDQLHVSLVQAIRAQDEKEILRFDLTVRGPIEHAEKGEVTQWFDKAREWIVNGFADLTSKDAHNYWRRRV